MLAVFAREAQGSLVFKGFSTGLVPLTRKAVSLPLARMCNTVTFYNILFVLQAELAELDKLRADYVSTKSDEQDDVFSEED